MLPRRQQRREGLVFISSLAASCPNIYSRRSSQSDYVAVQLRRGRLLTARHFNIRCGGRVCNGKRMWCIIGKPNRGRRARVLQDNSWWRGNRERNASFQWKFLWKKNACQRRFRKTNQKNKVRDDLTVQSYVVCVCDVLVCLKAICLPVCVVWVESCVR